MSELDAINARLEIGDQRFTELAAAMSDIKAHLQRQDTTMRCLDFKLDKISQDTDDVISMWNVGVKAVRVFCRLADAWRFVMRQVVLPFGIPFVGLYALWCFETGHKFPEWLTTVFHALSAVF